MLYEKVVIFWFRRDLRIYDNAGLYHALISGLKVIPLFIFDEEYYKVYSPHDKRLNIIFDNLMAIQKVFVQNNSSLIIMKGKIIDIFTFLIQRYPIAAVYANDEYEPYTIERDRQLDNFLKIKGISFYTFKDLTIFHKNEILNNSEKPYLIYTAYKKAWLKKFNEIQIQTFPSEKFLKNLCNLNDIHFPTKEQLGIQAVPYFIKPINFNHIKDYEKYRDIPILDYTSHVSVYLRYGTISIREVIKKTMELTNIRYLEELIWREFFIQILFFFPHLVSENFNPRFNFLQYRNNEKEYEKWSNGCTGFPIVDAGINELIHTGYMHNRVRMVVASFLTKHLLIDWRWGESFFAHYLLDYDLALNNGNWQWCAGTGVDAAPFFRIFNPILQQKYFDPDKLYIQKWLQYNVPIPIVNHTEARNRALSAFYNLPRT